MSLSDALAHVVHDANYVVLDRVAVEVVIME
jgi:hypothetical protein